MNHLVDCNWGARRVLRTCGNEGDYCGTYRRPCGLWLRSFTTCCRLDRKARWIPITTLAAEETDEIVLRALSLWALFFARGHKICQLAGTQTQRIMTLRERKATRAQARPESSSSPPSWSWMLDRWSGPICIVWKNTGSLPPRSAERPKTTPHTGELTSSSSIWTELTQSASQPCVSNASFLDLRDIGWCGFDHPWYVLITCLISWPCLG
jgi:hypothetical protein